MKELILIAWGILVIIIGFAFKYVAKKQKRKLTKYLGWHKLGLLVITFISTWTIFYFGWQSPHLNWALRLAILLLSCINLYVIYRSSWSERNVNSFEEDSFITEFSLVFLQGLLVSVVTVLGPQLTGLVDLKEVNLSGILWDLPLIFLLPFLILKLADWSSQRPFRVVEKRWVYPLEALNVEKLPWRNFMQINFQLKRSLIDEYATFSRSGKPWIEAPQEISLADTFRMLMQDRKKRADLKTFQDLGDEYQGEARFWWLFSIKVVWWNPLTWFRKPRYLDPTKNIMENNLRKYDIILARRIPMTEAMKLIHRPAESNHDDTVIIKR